MANDLAVDVQVHHNGSLRGLGCHVRISGLTVHNGLNGKRGELCAYVEVDDRWKVWLQDGGGKRLRPKNLEVCSPGAQYAKALGGDLAPGTHHRADLVFKVGARVRIHSAVLHAKLNGCEGEVMSFNDAERRWKVRLDTGFAKMARAEHLQVLASEAERPQDNCGVPQKPATSSSAFVYGDRVRVRFVTPGASHAGCCEGQIVSYDFDENRWRVWMDDGSGRLFKAECIHLIEHSPQNISTCSFGIGTNVKIVGLWARLDLNGQQADVIGIAEHNRVRVRLISDGTQLCFRRANLQVKETEGASTSGRCSGAILFSNGPEVGVLSIHVSERDSACSTKPRSVAKIAGNVDFARRDGVDAGRHTVRMDVDGQRSIPRPLNAKVDMVKPTREVVTHSSCGHVDDEAAQSALEEVIDVPQSQVDEIFEATQLKETRLVRLVGLRDNLDLNGRQGKLLSFDDGEGRWHVRLHDGEGLKIKPENLETIQEPQESKHEERLVSDPLPMLTEGSRAWMCGLVARADLNGQPCDLVEYVELEDRWKVRMENGSGKMLRTAHLCSKPPIHPEGSIDSGEHCTIELQRGSRVRAVGLQSRPDLNGCEGTLVEWVSNEGRWNIDMDNSLDLKLKLVNLESAGATVQGLVLAPDRGDNGILH